MGDNLTTTRRTTLKLLAVGGSVAGGAALSASAAAQADCPVEPHCYVTTKEARAYDICPPDAMSHVTYVDEGKAGFIMDSCSDTQDNCYYQINFECEELWWVHGTAIAIADDQGACTC